MLTLDPTLTFSRSSRPSFFHPICASLWPNAALPESLRSETLTRVRRNRTLVVNRTLTRRTVDPVARVQTREDTTSEPGSDEPTSVRALIEGLRLGNVRAEAFYTRLFVQLKRRLGLAFGAALDEGELEDVVASTFAKLLTNASYATRNIPVTPLVSTIARNAAVDAIRLKSIRRRTAHPPPLDDPQSYGSHPTESDIVETFLSSLGKEDRIILDAFAECLGRRGWSQRVAKELGWKPDAVRQRKKRLSDTLKERLEQSRRSE